MTILVDGYIPRTGLTNYIDLSGVEYIGDQLTLVSDPLSGDRTVARCEVTPETFSSGFSRTELTLGGTKDDIGGEYWYYFETLILSSEWPLVKDTPGVLLFQIHESKDTSDIAHNPPAALFTSVANSNNLGNALEFVQRHDSNEITTENSPNERILWKKSGIEFDKWIRWAYHVKYAFDTTGFIRLYRNDRLIYKIDNVGTTFNDHPDRGGNDAVRAKTGNYPGTGIGTGVSSRVVYVSGIVKGDASSSYEEVSGRPLLEPVVLSLSSGPNINIS